MSETTEILQGTIDELEGREKALTEEIERIQEDAKSELRDTQKALRSLRKQLNGAAPTPSDDPPPGPITNETKDAVIRELEARKQSGAAGARVAGLAAAASLNEGAVRAALDELEASGDVDTYGKGLWKVAE